MARKPAYEELEQGVRELEKRLAEERKHAEAMLEETQNIRQLLRFAPYGVYLIELSGKILALNRRGAEHLGRTVEEAVGTFMREYFPPEVAENRRRKGVEVVASGKAANFEEEVEGRWYDHSFFPILNDQGRVTQMAIFGADITERKRAAEALQESEARFRTAFENAAVGMALVSPDGIYLEVNLAMAHMMGYSQTELIGRPVADFTHPEDLGRRTQFIDDLITGKITSGEQERRFVHRDGSAVWTLIWASVQRDPNGRLLNFISLVQDITARKKAEEAKERLEAQLFQAQKMESIGTLAGGIAHDFNNLLMGIQGNASLMLLDIHSGHPHFERLRSIEQYVQNGAALTRQLLGFARAGKYDPRPTDLNEVIQKSLKMFGRTKKEIRIHEKYQERIWAVEVDLGQIEQVLLNLYVNAWQAMPGGGDLYLETENVSLGENHVQAYQLKPGRFAKISVTDTGVGMDQATQERIFEPFFTTRKMGRGTGLGLASVYGIIRNHNGFINVVSEKGQGTTFNVCLPASERELVEKKETTEKVLMGTERVLLVDDEDMIIEVGMQMLQKLGHKVLVARSGKEAIEVYRKNRDDIDLVVLDMIMPDMGGGETYDQLKQINPRLKVLLSSGYSINGKAAKILERGCDGFIQKPFNLNELSQRLRGILDR